MIVVVTRKASTTIMVMMVLILTMIMVIRLMIMIKKMSRNTSKCNYSIINGHVCLDMPLHTMLDFGTRPTCPIISQVYITQ